MICSELRDFVDHVMEQREICDADVNKLARDILPDGAGSQDVIDVLVALDRAMATPNANWSAFLVATVVDFVVWTSRPTGVVNRDLAQWLMASLTVGEGPTSNAMRIAFEVVREAERCDEELISFAMRKASLPARQDLSRCDKALLIA